MRKLFQKNPYRTRLLKLAEHLETLKTGRKAKVAFDMGATAFGTTGNDDFDIRNGKKYMDDFCGTVCCAVGSMPMSKYFRKQGFSYQRDDEGLIQEVHWNGRYFDFEDNSKEYFGLDMGDSDYLFMPSAYVENPTPKQVAKRIRNFVEIGMQTWPRY